MRARPARGGVAGGHRATPSRTPNRPNPGQVTTLFGLWPWTRSTGAARGNRPHKACLPSSGGGGVHLAFVLPDRIGVRRGLSEARRRAGEHGTGTPSAPDDRCSSVGGPSDIALERRRHRGSCGPGPHRAAREIAGRPRASQQPPGRNRPPPDHVARRQSEGVGPGGRPTPRCPHTSSSLGEHGHRSEDAGRRPRAQVPHQVRKYGRNGWLDRPQ